MDLDLFNNKIKLCIVGAGEWGSQVANVATMFSRFDFIGQIDSSTSEDIKYNLLKEATMVYIAVPQSAQLEYVNYCLDNNKYLICEAPFLSSLEERRSIFEKIKNNPPRAFIINSAYYMDTDFARIITGAISSQSKFTSIMCSGPKYKNDHLLAKKFYSNQSIFLILQIAFAKRLQKFDRFIIHNEYSGEFISGDSTFRFEWGYSDAPQNNIKIHTENEVVEKVLIYDKYDHIFPMFKFLTDQYYKIFAPALSSQKEEDIKEILKEVNMQGYLLSCTAEYFSDLFVQSSDSQVISDPLKLFFNGGF